MYALLLLLFINYQLHRKTKSKSRCYPRDMYLVMACCVYWHMSSKPIQFWCSKTLASMTINKNFESSFIFSSFLFHTYVCVGGMHTIYVNIIFSCLIHIRSSIKYLKSKEIPTAVIVNWVKWHINGLHVMLKMMA